MKKFLCLLWVIFFLHQTTLNSYSSQTASPEAKSFGGVGVFLEIENGSLIVLATIKDSPAYTSGIKAGDTIEAIDDYKVEKLERPNLRDVANRIKGEEGTSVTLTVSRGEKKMKVILARVQIQKEKFGWASSIGVGVILHYTPCYPINITSVDIEKANKRRSENKKPPQKHGFAQGPRSDNDRKEIERFVSEAEEVLKYHKYVCILKHLEEAYFTLGKFESAINIAMDLIKTNPDDSGQYYDVLRYLQMDEECNCNDNFDRMIALCDEFSKKHPKDMVFRQQLADHFWYTTERYEWAAKLYEEILKNEPECKNVEIYERLGTAYKLMGNKKKALTAFKTGVKCISNQSAIKKDSKNETLLKILNDEIDLINKE